MKGFVMEEKSPKYKTSDKPAARYSFDSSKQYALNARNLTTPEEWYQALVVNTPACHHPSPFAPFLKLKPVSELPQTPLVIDEEDVKHLPQDRLRRTDSNIMEATVPYTLGAVAIDRLLNRS